MTLCARCYVRGNYRVGVVSSSDFRRVEINDDTRTDWTDKETLHLLEALTHYGDDWKKVAQHVGGRTERECVAHFVKLPLGEQFHGYPDSEHIDNNYTVVKDHASANLTLESTGASIPNKRIRLSPLADASNPIMAQVSVGFCPFLLACISCLPVSNFVSFNQHLVLSKSYSHAKRSVY